MCVLNIQHKYYWNLIVCIFVLLFLFLLFLYNHTHEKVKDIFKHACSSSITFIDVGNSDTIVLNVCGNKTLIDGGNDKSSSVYFSYKNLFSICSFENIVLTHPHKDHLYGLVPLIKNCNITSLFFNKIDFESDLYNDFLHLISAKSTNLNINELHKGDELKFLNTSIYVVWPPENFKDVNPNNHSISLLIDSGNFEVLLLGDLEYLFQENLLYEEHLKHIDFPLEVIKVPHQGSKDALNKKLLHFLQPQVAVFSVGENEYGHPNQETLDFYSQLGSKIMRTDTVGTIVINIPEMPSEQ